MRGIRPVLVVLVVTAVVLGISVLVYLSSPDEVPGATRAPAVPDDAERARVVSHVDGDTVHLTGSRLLRGETSVRLLEIDTPEPARDGEPGECFADEASAALRDLLPVGARVWVMPDEDLYDRYGRTLLYLWTEDGRLVNLTLVRRGFARAVLFEPNDRYIVRMREAESEARADRRGLWGACP